MSRKSIEEAKSILSVGKDILAGLKKSLHDMDDVMYDMDNSTDHNRTAQKLNELYVTVDRIPDIPKLQPERTKKKATRK